MRTIAPYICNLVKQVVDLLAKTPTITPHVRELVIQVLDLLDVFPLSMQLQRPPSLEDLRFRLYHSHGAFLVVEEMLQSSDCVGRYRRGIDGAPPTADSWATSKESKQATDTEIRQDAPQVDQSEAVGSGGDAEKRKKRCHEIRDEVEEEA